MAWTHITDPDKVASFLPAWFAGCMIGLRGRFGLVLTTGDVMKITSIAALHQSSDGIVLLDVLLDHAGVPEGVDLAWHRKHYLGAPVSGATLATVNLAHVVAAIEFVAVKAVAQPDAETVPARNEVVVGLTPIGSLAETIERANEVGTT